MNTLGGLVLMAAFLSAQDPPATPKAQPPETAALVDAEKVIKDLFKDDYAKKAPKDRAVFGAKLLEQARQPKNELPSQFVLFREAQDLLAQGVELGVCFEAIDDWDRRFIIDAVDYKVKAVASASKNAKSPAEVTALAAANLKITDAAVQLDRFDVAEKAVQASLAAARRIANVPAVNRATAKSKEVADQKAAFDKIRKARDTLTSMPDDPDANLVVGRYQCWIKGLWESGLPLLAKGSDATLKSLAAKDLAAPQAPEECISIADGWWELSDKQQGPARVSLKGRAAKWYDRAAPKLTGLQQTKASQRSTEYYNALLYSGSWVDVDPKLLKGKTGETEPPAAGFYYKVLNPMPPGGEFDAVSVRIRPTGQETGVITLSIQKLTEQDLLFDSKASTLSLRHKDGSKKPGESASFEQQSEYIMTLILSEDAGVVYLNGREKFRFTTSDKQVSSLRIDRLTGSYTFDQIRLRKKN